MFNRNGVGARRRRRRSVSSYNNKLFTRRPIEADCSVVVVVGNARGFTHTLRTRYIYRSLFLYGLELCFFSVCFFPRPTNKTNRAAPAAAHVFPRGEDEKTYKNKTYTRIGILRVLFLHIDVLGDMDLDPRVINVVRVISFGFRTYGRTARYLHARVYIRTRVYPCRYISVRTITLCRTRVVQEVCCGVRIRHGVFSQSGRICRQRNSRNADFQNIGSRNNLFHFYP